MCKTNNFPFICNNVIDNVFLWKDGLHLTYEGISQLLNNFLLYLTRFLLQSNEFNVNKFNSNLFLTQILIQLLKKQITDNFRSTSAANLDRKEMRTQNFSNVIIVNLNIDSLTFEFDELRLVVTGISNILIITETRLEDTFPLSQFHIDDFSTPYRLDRNRNTGGILIYIREDIPGRVVTKHCCPKDIEALFIELNFRKCKWLLCGLYHSTSHKDQYFFDNIDKALDVYSRYEKVILCRDFNSQICENYINTFIYHHNLQSINKEPSCYKNSNNPSCIYLFLKSRPRSFYQTKTFTGLKDFHRIVLSVFKIKQAKAKEMIYRGFKKFHEQYFNNHRHTELSSKSIKSYDTFENIFLNTLNKHAPRKKKY